MVILKILVIEDDHFSREGLTKILSSEGYEVSVAENGEEGFEKAISEHYDLIITDLMMPFMDGMKLLSRLKSMECDTPVIVITAYSSIDNMLSVYQLGGIEVLEKPFEIHELFNLIKRIL
ncbi:response regulator [Deferribacterales bacterium Es71-Z0220]|uniref:response regulator transcription factor n=1 Tax=Deferrivibrio essentukiensis TaxID=2880922 RepID=UPI001F604EDA|nr:response regulator [Deferrivibrio essentukiensis]